MRTHHLINVLSQDQVSPPNIRARVVAFAGVGLLFAGFMTYAVLGFRSDLLESLFAPVTAMKLILPVLVSIPALVACLALIDPQKRRTPVVWMSAAVGGIALLWYVLAAMQTPSDLLWPTMRGSTIGRCLVSITVLSIIPLLAALWWLRDGASISPMRSGALAGLAISGVTAAFYSMSCNEDAPLFFLLWYSLAMILVASLGAVLGKRMLRW